MVTTHDSPELVINKGPLIVNIQPLFWHPQRYPGRRVSGRPPLTERAVPRELEQPYRKGHGRVFRFPLTRRAVVFGWWEPATDVVLADEEDVKLLEAVEGAHIPGITATEIANWARARDWTRVQLLVRRLRALLRLQPAPAPVEEAVASALEYEDTWTVRPWNDSDVVDLNDARVGS